MKKSEQPGRRKLVVHRDSIALLTPQQLGRVVGGSLGSGCGMGSNRPISCVEHEFV
jgi:hypothetical protein